MGLFCKIRGFASDTRGGALVETVLFTPLMASAIVMTFVFFDAFKTRNLAQKASYTIADLLSRQTEGVDEDYIDGMKDLFAYLSQTSDANSGLRVTSIFYKKKKDLYQVKWSYGAGDEIKSWKTSKLKKLKEQLPDVANKDYLILVETFVEYDPPFSGIIGSQEFETWTPVSPRYSPKLAWSGD